MCTRGRPPPLSWWACGRRSTAGLVWGWTPLREGLHTGIGGGRTLLAAGCSTQTPTHTGMQISLPRACGARRGEGVQPHGHLVGVAPVGAAPGCPTAALPISIKPIKMSFWRGLLAAGVAIRTLSLFFFFLLRQPLSDVWWLPTNRHRLPTNRHRLPTNRHRLHTNRHRLHTNRHRLHTNRHRLHTNRHQLPTGRHHRAYWTLRVFFIFFIMATPGLQTPIFWF